ncbi:DUF4179 domain-containing protein [[Clostridium] dakarense]|uniref:DUF4179 domain-containing protein n=1 Tax=Faecalimicrobium dakarense TaxID=1301100 RepID=UPI0004B9446C|nr:DUF4179 domain-containing protein [[Clostridium] dakarense]
MKNNIYEMLNEANIDLDEYKKQDFTEFEKKKIKNRFKRSINKKNFYKKGIAVASVAVVSVGILGSNVGTYAFETLGAIAYDISESLGIKKDIAEYKTVVNQGITKNGIKVKLNEVILDNEELIVSTTATSDKKLDESGYISISGDVYINGRRVSDGSSGGASKLDDYSTESVISHSLDNIDEDDLKGDINIKIKYNDALIGGKVIRGSWVFEFKTNGDELRAETKEIKLENTFKFDNGQNIKLEKYTSNDIGQKIYFSLDSKGTDYNMELRGHDDLGNEVTFYISRVRGDKGIFKINNIDGLVNENAKELKLTLYAAEQPKTSGKMSNDFKAVGEEFIINLNK